MILVILFILKFVILFGVAFVMSYRPKKNFVLVIIDTIQNLAWPITLIRNLYAGWLKLKAKTKNK